MIYLIIVVVGMGHIQQTLARSVVLLPNFYQQEGVVRNFVAFSDKQEQYVNLNSFRTPTYDFNQNTEQWYLFMHKSIHKRGKRHTQQSLLSPCVWKVCSLNMGRRRRHPMVKLT